MDSMTISYLSSLAQGVVGQSDLVEADGSLHPSVTRGRGVGVEIEASRGSWLCSAAHTPGPVTPLVTVLTIRDGLDAKRVETVWVQAGQGDGKLREHPPVRTEKRVRRHPFPLADNP